MRNLLDALGAFFMDTLEIIVLALAMFALIYLFLAQPHRVQGDSMLPNFHSGEYVLTDKVGYHFREPERGEVVIFKYPGNEKIDYIKRLIGLPGERLKIENGNVIICNNLHPDCFVLEENYLKPGMKTAAKKAIAEGVEVIIPEGNYIALGDNRGASSDSREWGFVPEKNIIGRAWFRYWPLPALSLLPTPSFGY